MVMGTSRRNSGDSQVHAVAAAAIDARVAVVQAVAAVALAAEVARHEAVLARVGAADVAVDAVVTLLAEDFIALLAVDHVHAILAHVAAALLAVSHGAACLAELFLAQLAIPDVLAAPWAVRLAADIARAAFVLPALRAGGTVAAFTDGHYRAALGA